MKKKQIYEKKKLKSSSWKMFLSIITQLFSTKFFILLYIFIWNIYICISIYRYYFVLFKRIFPSQVFYISVIPSFTARLHFNLTQTGATLKFFNIVYVEWIFSVQMNGVERINLSLLILHEKSFTSLSRWRWFLKLFTA